MNDPRRTVKLRRDVLPSDEIDRDELLDLYKLVIEEYHFQVKLNSDRTQIYLVLNAAIITAATGLLKVGGAATAPYVAAILLLGAVVALVASTTPRCGFPDASGPRRSPVN